MTDIGVVLRVVDTLEAARLRVWLFGGWAEELRGLRVPCEHVDVDLLYPGRDFARVDKFIGDDVVDERSHKRSFEVDGVPVELLLVQKDEQGWYTELPRRKHRWPRDVFATAGRLPVASATALDSYRHSRRADSEAA
jgi:hypothetical protein